MRRGGRVRPLPVFQNVTLDTKLSSHVLFIKMILDLIVQALIFPELEEAIWTMDDDGRSHTARNNHQHLRDFQ